VFLEQNHLGIHVDRHVGVVRQRVQDQVTMDMGAQVAEHRVVDFHGTIEQIECPCRLSSGKS
jgi:hypothetical protein